MIDTYTLLHIVKSYYHVDNYDLHLKLKVASKKYYEHTKNLNVEKFFNVIVEKVVRVITYRVCGVLHRLHGPARVEYYKNGAKKCETYYINGKHHREDKHVQPAYIEYHPNGVKKCIKYYMNGKLHSRGMPAHVSYHRDGSTYTETYYDNGKIHSNDINKPAHIEYHKRTHVIKRKIYYVYGRIYREYGPAILIYNIDGVLESGIWYVNGY